MEPNTAPKWIACGKSMKISENERVITKNSNTCKFGVALSERLTDTVYEIDVTFQGDCYYFAIGLAVWLPNPALRLLLLLHSDRCSM